MNLWERIFRGSPGNRSRKKYIPTRYLSVLYEFPTDIASS
jgi:hypothetical protein